MPELTIVVRTDEDNDKVRLEMSDSSDLIKVAGLLIVGAVIVATQAVSDVDKKPLEGA